MTPTCIWALAAKLGEGALWWRGAIWFTDIKLKRIHRFDPTSGAGQAWDAPAEPGFIAPMLIYFVGTLLVVAGLAYGAYRMGVNHVWIIAGSLVIALALAEGEIDARTGFDIAHLDELWQVERWGEDESATRMRDAHARDFKAAARFLALLV